MKTSSLRHKIYPVLIILIFRFFLSQCATTAGGSAAPQASIPLPNAQDPVTVSSPDDEGNARIVGASGSVPNSAVVILKAGVTPTANESLSRDASFRVDCTSTLPVCPTVDADRQCQGAASEDGSFSLLIPATEGEYVLVSYLDSENTCTETAGYSVLVAEGVNRLDYEIYDGVAGWNNNVYLYGKTEDDGTVVVNFTPSTEIPSETLLFDIGTTSLAIAGFSNNNGDLFLVLQSGTDFRILPVGDDGSLSTDQIISVYDEDGLEIENGSYMASYSTTFSTMDMPTPVSCIQVFIYAGQQLHVFGFDEDPSDPSSEWGYADSEGDIVTHTIDLDFSILESTFPGYTDSNISSMRLAGEQMLVLMSFTYESEVWIVALKRAYNSSTDFISETISFEDDENTEMIILGTSEADVTLEWINGLSTLDDYGYEIGVAVIKTAEQTVTFLDMTADPPACYDDTVFVLPGSPVTSDPGNECDDVLGSVDDTLQLNFDELSEGLSLSMMSVLFDSSDQVDIFMLGNLNTGSGFVTEHGGASVFDTGVSVNVMAPVFVEYSSGINSLVIVDQGIENDYSSNMIIYELAATPSSY